VAGILAADLGGEHGHPHGHVLDGGNLLHLAQQRQTGGYDAQFLAELAD
jgi:hypothetical protein